MLRKSATTTWIRSVALAGTMLGAVSCARHSVATDPSPVLRDEVLSITLKKVRVVVDDTRLHGSTLVVDYSVRNDTANAVTFERADCSVMMHGLTLTDDEGHVWVGERDPGGSVFVRPVRDEPMPVVPAGATHDDSMRTIPFVPVKLRPAVSASDGRLLPTSLKYSISWQVRISGDLYKKILAHWPEEVAGESFPDQAAQFVRGSGVVEVEWVSPNRMPSELDEG